MAIKFFKILGGLKKIFTRPAIGSITDHITSKNYNSVATSSGITEDSVVHVDCTSQDAQTYGAHYLTDTEVLMMNGSPFVDAKNIVHGISMQVHGVLRFLAPKGLLKSTDYVRIGRFRRPAKYSASFKGISVPNIESITYTNDQDQTVTWTKLTLSWQSADSNDGSIEYWNVTGNDVSISDSILVYALTKGTINGASGGVDPMRPFEIGDKIAFSIWRDGYQISDWFTWRIATHAAGVNRDGNETPAKNILVPSKGLYLPGIQEVTAAKMMKKLECSKLVPGRQYKIVDYDPNGALSSVLPATIPAGELCVTAISKCELSPMYFDAGYAYVNGDISAGSFTKTNGTDSQFLMANGTTLDGLNATATKVSADSNPSVTFANGTFNFNIPSGKDGAKGDKGDTGATGNGIESMSYAYKATPTQTQPSASAITATTIPTLSATNKYLWQKETVTFTNGSTQVNITLIGTYGDTGATGPQGSVKSLSTDGSGAVVTNVSLANDALTISKGDVGGRNLLREGKWRNATITSETYLGNPVYSASGSTTSYTDVTYTGTLAGLLRNNGVYTVSFYAKASGAIADSNGGKIAMYFYNVYQSSGHYLTAKVKASWGYTLDDATGGDGKTYNISLTTAWQKYYVTYTLMDTVPEESACKPSLILFRLRSTTSGTTVYFSNVKLEEGSVPTAWCPAYEDLEIGGRNLLKNSANRAIGVWGTTWASGVTNGCTGSAGDDYYQVTINTAPTNALSTHTGIYGQITNTAWADRKITISAMLYSSYADKVKIGLVERYIDSNNNTTITLNQYYNHNADISLVANKWQQVSWTFESVKDLYVASNNITPNNLYLIIAGTNTPVANAYWRVKNWKVEFGNKPTDWTPAPEDVDASIVAAQEAAQAYADDAVANRVKYNTAAVLFRNQTGPVKVATLANVTEVNSNYGTLFSVHDTFTKQYWGLFEVRVRYDNSWNGNITWLVKSSALSVDIFSIYYDSTTSTLGLYCTRNETDGYYYPMAITQLSGVAEFGEVRTALNWTMINVPNHADQITYTATGSLICTSTIGTLSNPTTGCLRVDGLNTMNSGVEIKTNGGDSYGILLRDKLNENTYNVIGIAKKAGSLDGQVTAGYGDLVIGNQSYPMVLRTKGDTLYHYNGSSSYKIYDRNNLSVELAKTGTTYDESYLPNGTLDDLTQAGFYSCKWISTAKLLKNIPQESAFQLQVYTGAGVVQVWTDYELTNIYMRQQYRGSWSGWKQVYFASQVQNAIDTSTKFVKKTGDTMTGNLAIATATDPTLTLGSSTIKYNSTTGCLEIKA